MTTRSRGKVGAYPTPVDSSAPTINHTMGAHHRCRQRSVDDPGKEVAPVSKPRPLDVDQINLLSIAMPLGIWSPRINYSSKHFGKFILERHFQSQDQSPSDIPTVTHNPSSSTSWGELPTPCPSNLDHLPHLKASQSPAPPQRSQSARLAHTSRVDKKLQALCIQIEDYIYTGKLWDIYRGSLSITNHDPHDIPVVMKVMRPNAFDPIWLEDGEEDDGLAASYTTNRDYDVQSAIKAANNEDAIYNQLVELQGTVVPKYYGLFVSQSVNGDPGSDATIPTPELMVMLLEDLGKQVNPHDFLDDEYSMKECQRINRLYEKLHKRGRVAHGFPKTWHILRRQSKSEKSKCRLVIVDFAIAESPEEMTEEEQDSALQADEGMLMRANRTWRDDKGQLHSSCVRSDQDADM